MNDLTTYQIYLILLGYLTERHDDTQMLESMLVELYRRASKEENEVIKNKMIKSEEKNGRKKKKIVNLVNIIRTDIVRIWN